MMGISNKELKRIDAYFRALNYISVGQLYLVDNPLLKEELKWSHVKKKIVGHWGTVPGQNFIYTHLNRVIKNNDLNMIYISGPGHGGNAVVSNVYLEGTYSEIYPEITEDTEGLKKLFKQFSFPGGIASHAAPETPGSINEGGELGYSLSHAFGAVFDNPDLIAACVVGDGEAETGPLATSWHSNKFLNPKTDGAVLPILHLNGYKISNPTVLSRISDEELASLFYGYGWKPYLVEASNTMDLHKKMAITLDKIIKEIKKIQYDARYNNKVARVFWPMIVLRTPKGWTGPKVVNGKKIEGTFRSHQVPIPLESDEDLKLLEKWMKSYHPEELFDDNGHLLPYLKELVPYNRMGANPNANGGLLLKELKIPSINKYAVKFSHPGEIEKEDMRVLGEFIRDIIKSNPNNFRAFGPDETMSNRLSHIFEADNRCWYLTKKKDDEYLSYDGRIMDSYLSEHTCEGWLEGYLLTGRHGFFASYEAFIRIVDSMASQHAKWLKVANELPWRKDIASLNYILTSNVWQQDHNGYTHQDPGFIDHLANKKADIVRVYLPPDSNCLLSCFDHVIRTKNYINVIVASKHMRPQWLTMEEAKEHCAKGLSKWEFASNDNKGTDIVLVSIGDAPTLENMAAVSIIRSYLPDIKIRFINVVDLMKLEPNTKHPHGLTNVEYNKLFTKDKPIIFNYHGYPTLIHELTYERENKNISVHGYMEEGTITTPFDMRVKNEIDRYHIVIDIINHLEVGKTREGKKIIRLMEEKLKYHDSYIREYGIDMEEVRLFKWE
ncbi:MAG: phosphoketolase family protein [Firmicutes bacterium]|nr:phosphoketolase family protein [Bacillota bacterium]MDY5336383.1 phosphoketolase family protein [Bacilli bacterium]